MPTVTLTEKHIASAKRATGLTRAEQAVRAVLDALPANPVAARPRIVAGRDAAIINKHARKLSREAMDAMRYQIPL